MSRLNYAYAAVLKASVTFYDKGLKTVKNLVMVILFV